jgi:hypothetical protein
MDNHVSHHFRKSNRQFSALSFALQRAFAAGHILTHKSPVKCALHYAELFHDFAITNPARSVEFFEMAGEMETEAAEILLGLGDDYAAAIMLEETETEMLPVMKIALRAGSREFIGSQRVMRISQRLWAVPLLRPPQRILDDRVFTVPGMTFWAGSKPDNRWSNNSQAYDRYLDIVSYRFVSLSHFVTSAIH